MCQLKAIAGVARIDVIADKEILGSQFVILIIELVNNSRELSLLHRRQYQELIK
jgi:hypothetical protein